MKKAREYAEQILSSADEASLNREINETFQALVQEISEIGQARRIGTNRALKAIILEQKQKWAAICRIVNRDRVMLKEDGFIEMLELVLPETKIILRS